MPSEVFDWMRSVPTITLVPRVKRDALLARVVASALEQGHNLAPVFTSLANDSLFPGRASLRKVGWAIEAGMSLTEAANRHPTAFRPEIRRAIVLGEATGTTAAQLRLTASLLDKPPAARFGDYRSSWLYFTMLISVTSSIVSFIMFYIIPKFKKIFYDFGTDLPEATKVLIQGCDASINYFHLVLLPLAILTFFYRTGWYYESRLWNVSRLGYWRPWYRPRSASANLLRELCVAREKSIPPPEFLHQLTVTATVSPLRKTFLAVATRLEAGYPLWNTLAEHKFLTASEAATLAAADQIGNHRWVILSLADNLEQRQGFLKAVRHEFVMPMATLAMGLLVGFVVVSLFLPIVKLINDLS